MKNRKRILRLQLRLILPALIAALLSSSIAHADIALPDLPTVNQRIGLTEAIHLALANNVALKQSQSDIQAATASERSVKAQTKPSIATTTYGLIGDSNNIVASSPGVMPPNYLSTPPRGVLDQNVILMAPLFTGGKLSGLTQSASAQKQAAISTLDDNKLMVQAEVIEAYTKVLLQKTLVDVAQSRLDAENEQVRVTEAKVKTGRSAPVDLLREQAEQSDARQSLLEAQNNVEQALIALKTALGISQISDITLADTFDNIALTAKLPESQKEAISQAEAHRPNLAASLQQVEAAHANILNARGAYAPQVYAIGMADASALSIGGGRAGYTVGLAASLPLYDGGARRADEDVARARLDRAVADAQSVRQGVDQEAASAWLNWQTASQQVETAKIGVDAAQQSYALATLRYNAGKSVASERLDALAALTRAQGSLAQAKAQRIISQAQLQRALGAAYQ